MYLYGNYLTVTKITKKGGKFLRYLQCMQIKYDIIFTHELAIVIALFNRPTTTDSARCQERKKKQC